MGLACPSYSAEWQVLKHNFIQRLVQQKHFVALRMQLANRLSAVSMDDTTPRVQFLHEDALLQEFRRLPQVGEVEYLLLALLAVLQVLYRDVSDVQPRPNYTERT